MRKSQSRGTWPLSRAISYLFLRFRSSPNPEGRRSRAPFGQCRPQQLVLEHKTYAWTAGYHELHECEEAVFCCTTDIHVRRDAFLNRCGAERQSLPHSPRTERVRAWELLDQTSTDMDVRRTSVAPGTRAVALTVRAVLNN